MLSNLKKLLFLFYAPPILAFLAYLGGGTTATNTTFMICNLLCTLLLIFWFKNKKNRKIAIIYSIYFLICFALYPSIEGSKMYLSTVLNTCIILLFFSSEKLNCNNELSKRTIDKTIIFFAIFLIIAQLLTIKDPLSFIRFNYNSVDEDALEQKGFLISHTFGYYLAAFIIYFSFKRQILFMCICTILCFFFTRRTNVILCSLGWFYYIQNRFGLKYVILFSILSVFFLISYINVTSYFGDFAFSLDPSDSESAAFTSGRTRFWGSYIVYLQSGIMNIGEYVFGFGPASSREFNEIHSGLNVWMHNDFFDLAFCLGFFGLFLYIYTIYKITQSLGSGILIFILISANLNGFMLYQIYPIVLVYTIIKELKSVDYSKKIELVNSKHPYYSKS